MDLELLLSFLTAKDTKQAYGALLELERLSEETDDLYPYTEHFTDMVGDRSYAVRVRGFRLFCRQARWDAVGVVDRNLDRALAILMDEKPTAVRQALASLEELLPYKRGLWPVIRQRLEAMEPGQYRETVAPLIEKDIRRLLESMK